MAAVGFVLLVVVVLLFAMTTAWFTNVVQTQGLTFQAETWGFSGNVILPQKGILAAPGDTGVIEMNVVSDSPEASALTVSITKEYMTPQQMQKRIYFYADQTATVNGEQVQRQYISNTGGYCYTVGGKGALVLSETVCSDVPLKWQWVFDVVGYYFTGIESEGVILPTEYIRPVEYDYYEAQYSKNGTLLMVDKNTSAAEFVQELTETDGYPGAFKAVKQGGTMVLVDEKGEAVQKYDGAYCIRQATETEPAVWLYLCTLDEIEENTLWDTNFVKLEQAERAFSARISLTGVQIKKEAVGVSDPAVLAETLNSGNNVKLEHDVTLPQGITLAQGVDTTLDLNGHTLTYTGNTPAFLVESGSKLAVCNGTVVGGEKTTAFRSVGGQITLSDLTVKDVFCAVRIEDHLTKNEHGANSVVRIVDCDLQSKDDTVEVCGDGVASGGKTLLVIENSNIASQTYVGVLGKGNSTNPSQWGTEIQIINSTVSGYYAGIYHPMQQSALTISGGSVISGMTGIAMKGGSLTVTDSTVQGTGVEGVVDLSTDPKLTGSGWLDTGDGIYVETDYKYPISVVVSGNSLVTCAATTARAVRVYPEAEHVTVALFGGTYNTDVTEYVAQGCSCKLKEAGYVVTQN